MKHRALYLAAVLTMSGVSHATIVGFGQLGGSNAAVPKTLASRAAADGNGFVVTNGTTPNIVLDWDVDGENNNGNPNSNGWDIHTSSWFVDIENQTIGGGDWDNEGSSNRVGQLDFDYHSIGFAADPGAALVLNSFDFGNTEETMDSSVWDLSLTDSADNVVWSQQVTLTNPDSDVLTVSPNFTGTLGESYTLIFAGVNDPINGRHAIDNLSFNQIPDLSNPVGSLVINRSGPNAGTAYIQADQALSFSDYEIRSANGALNPEGWNSIASTNGDPNDTWSEVSATTTSLREQDGANGTNDGVSLNVGGQFNLGQAFSVLPQFHLDGTTPTGWEDAGFSIYDPSGTLLALLPEYSGDPVPWGDYNGDLSIDIQDWYLFSAGLGQDYTGMTAIEAYLGGDLDGDFDSDLFDYKLFVELAGGASNLFGTTQVPEPSSIALVALGGMALLVSRRYRATVAVLVTVVAMAVATRSHAQATLQDFSVVGSTPTTSIPEGQQNESETAGPDQWFDDGILDETGQIVYDLFSTNYTDADLFPNGFKGQYAIGGETPGEVDSAVVFMDYGSPVTANWFAYAQRTGNNAVADKVGRFDFWFSNVDFAGVVPTTNPDATFNLLSTDNRISDSTIRPYTLGGSHSGQYVAVRITETDESGAVTSTSRIGGHEFRLLDGPSDVVLTVDRSTGEMTLANNLAGAENIQMNGYSIESPGGALIAENFDGVGGDASFPLGTGSGNGWEVTEGSNSSRLVESYFTANPVLNSTFAAGTGPISLGNAYQGISGHEDLVFLWTNSQGEVYNARVEYMGVAPGVAGDYNDDGIVDLADYTVWRNNLGGTNVLSNDLTPDSVAADDYATWKTNFGKQVGTLGGVVAASVPEPSTVLMVFASAMPVVLLRRKCKAARS